MDSGNCLLLSFLSQIRHVKPNYKCVYLRRRMALQAAIYAKAYFVSFKRELCVTQPCDMVEDTCSDEFVHFSPQTPAMQAHLVEVRDEKKLASYSYKQWVYDLCLETTHLSVPAMNLLSDVTNVSVTFGDQTFVFTIIRRPR